MATSRDSQRAGALRVTLLARAVRIDVGGIEVAQVPWPASCPLALRIEDGELATSQARFELDTPAPGDMPIVSGLFTERDIRRGAPPNVVVATRDYATSWTSRQVVAGSVAALSALAALVLLSLSSLRRPRRVRRGLEAVWGAADETDAFVLTVVLGWWILAPTYPDDAWFSAEYQSLRQLGAVTFYFDHWGVITPLGAWVGWLSEWIGGGSRDLVVMRLPSLAALVASWPVCRYCALRVLGQSSRSSRWLLASSFLVGAIAWGMTIRPEPFVALLTLICLAAMVSFELHPRFLALGVALVACVLAMTAHPTGVVAIAPLAVGAGRFLGQRRLRLSRSLMPIVVLAGAAVALGLVLFTLDGDLAHRFADARVVRQDEFHAGSWWDEHLRYRRFDEWGGGTTLRRLSVGLMVLTVIAVLTRRRSTVSGISTLPALSLALGLLLLAVVPSKWPWHFGALAVLAGVASAVEGERLVREYRRSRDVVRLSVATTALVALGLWAWSASGISQSPFGLQVLSWQDGFNAGTWVLVLLAPCFLLLTRRLRQRRRQTRGDVLPFLAVWTFAGVAIAAIGITITLLATDALKAPWTPTRQNIDALAARESCGLAAQLSGGGAIVRRMEDHGNSTLSHPTLGAYFPCARIPRVADEGLVEIPNLIVTQRDAYSMWSIVNPFTGVRELYSLHEVATGPRGLTVYEVEQTIREFDRLDAQPASTT